LKITKKFIVITSINHKSKALYAFENMKDVKVIVVGDKKSVPIESSEKLIYLSVKEQKLLGFETSDTSNNEIFTP